MNKRMIKPWLIVADEQIVELELLSANSAFTLVKMPAAAIDSKVLSHADGLLVRSVTAVNASLLAGTKVGFVGTLTSGTDHLDTLWLQRQGIHYVSAHGANAHAVLEYVLSCLASLQTRQLMPRLSGQAGVIGVGKVGALVVRALQHLGFKVLMNDPVRAQQDPRFISTPLNKFVGLDLICVHPQLIVSGAYPSYHLLDDEFLRRQHSGCVLINASRGAVIDTAALLANTHLSLCLDVWEHEPLPNLQLLQQAKIATPHIAGYSRQAKQLVFKLVYQQLCDFFGQNKRGRRPAVLDNSDTIVEGIAATDSKKIPLDTAGEWQRQACLNFDLLACTKLMQQQLLQAPASELGQRFEALRAPFVKRDEFLLFD